jgi:hypothetical protein
MTVTRSGSAASPRAPPSLTNWSGRLPAVT